MTVSNGSESLEFESSQRTSSIELRTNMAPSARLSVKYGGFVPVHRIDVARVHDPKVSGTVPLPVIHPLHTAWSNVTAASARITVPAGVVTTIPAALARPALACSMANATDPTPGTNT